MPDQNNNQIGGFQGIQQVPYHIHNGLDAPQLPFTSISTYQVSTDGTMAADSQTLIPTQSAVVTYVASQLGNAGAEYWGDGSDGPLTASSGTTNLTRDTFYTDVNLSGIATINLLGFRLFVNGTLTISGTAHVQSNGSAASAGQAGNTAGTAGAGGAGGNSPATGSVPGGLTGATGGNGRPVPNNTNGLPGFSGGGGTATNPSIGTSSVTNTTGIGGSGGNAGSKSGGGSSGGGAGASATIALNLPRNIFACYENFDQIPTFTLHQGSASSGAGGGGSQGGADGQPNGGQGGGGGGSGGTGGIGVIFAKNIVNSSTGGIRALGGNGGNGGNAANSVLGIGPSIGGCGGGGGGGGGNGGVLIIVYGSLTQTGTFDVSGGNGGTGGTGGNGAGASFTNGANGGNGETGASGAVWQVQVT